MTNKKAVLFSGILSSVSAVFTAPIHALQLGDASLFSVMNEPLKSHIEVLIPNNRTTSANTVHARLASQSAFYQAGVEPVNILQHLQFKTVTRPNGTAYIEVTSNQPIREPFLNFVIETEWPTGRLLRQYTLLLDPPAPTSTTPTLDFNTNQYQIADNSSAPQTSSAPPTGESQPSPQQTESYTIKANDTLWEIARDVRPSKSISIQQMMIALQALNPHAFINDNINLLKRGKVLRVPTQAQIAVITPQESVELIAAQSNDPQSLTATPLDATHQDSPTFAGRQNAADRLSIVTHVDPTATGNSELQPHTSDTAYNTKLTVTQEQLDKSKRENDELKSRLNDLQEQINTLKRLLVLKDEQMARLQARLEELEAPETVPQQSLTQVP
ncbi:type IV pilus assembly protein FimV [Zooshikella sp. RANM57]|uniref:type IV pilus assembly protein FimV n=1 Tax=Zooshikella sp. RANM57 TaxID=3425863 RepID=UPI003D6E41A3